MYIDKGKIMSSKKNGNKGKKTENQSDKKEVACGKRSGKITRAEKVAASIAAGKVPDYSPKDKTAAAANVIYGQDSVIAEILFTGTRLGLIRLHDVTFKVSTEITGKYQTETIVVRVYGSKPGTTLSNLSDTEKFTFITLKQLRAPIFESYLENSARVEVQRKMYNFIHPIFEKEGLLSVSKSREAVKKEMKPKILPLEKLMGGKDGFYDFSLERKKLIVKLFKNKEDYQLEVVQIDKDYPLLANSINVGFSVPSVSFYRNVIGDDVKVNTFISHLRGILTQKNLLPVTKSVAVKPVIAEVVTDVHLGIAVASQFESLPPGGEIVANGRGLYGRCHGSHSTHEKV